jgi:hypothetical protein
MTRNGLRFIAMTLPVLALALTPTAARAQVYTGSWPFVVTQQESVIGPISQTTTYCITLTDNGAGFGRTHSGEATIAPTPALDLHEKAYGSFQIIGQLIMVTIGVPGGEGESDAWVFVASTTGTSNIGTGVFSLVAGGESFTSGLLTVGAKHGCAPGS